MVINEPTTKTDTSTDPKDPKDTAITKLLKDRDNLLDLIARKQAEVSEAIKDGNNVNDVYME